MSKSAHWYLSNKAQQAEMEHDNLDDAEWSTESTEILDDDYDGDYDPAGMDPMEEFYEDDAMSISEDEPEERHSKKRYRVSEDDDEHEMKKRKKDPLMIDLTKEDPEIIDLTKTSDSIPKPPSIWIPDIETKLVKPCFEDDFKTVKRPNLPNWTFNVPRRKPETLRLCPVCEKAFIVKGVCDYCEKKSPVVVK